MTEAREQQLLAEIGRLHMELLQQTSAGAGSVPSEGPAEPPPGPRRPQRTHPNGRS